MELADKSGAPPRVSLTFDDGPGERTDELLDLLARENVPATFFLLGANAERHPEVVGRMRNLQGIEVANHSTTHQDLTTVGRKGVVAEIQRTNQILDDLAEPWTGYVRPPWGRHDPVVRDVARVQGHPLILYSLDCRDWSHHSTIETIRIVTENAVDGDIVLLHDTLGTTVDAVAKIIEGLRRRGFRFLTVSALLGETVPGQAYYGRVSSVVSTRRWISAQVLLWRRRFQRLLGRGLR